MEYGQQLKKTPHTIGICDMSAFGEALIRLMAERKMGVHALARRSHYSAGYISNLRNGTRRPSPECGAEFDEILGAGGELAALASSGFSPEPAAEPPVTGVGGAAFWLPASAAMAADDVSPVEHLSQFRRVISDHDNLFGPRSVIPVVRDQLTLIRQLRHSRGGADSRNLLVIQAQYAETLAWLCQDSTDFRSAQYWLDRALEWAHMAGDMQWAAFVLARKSQLAGDMHDPVAAVDLAEAAARLAGDGTRLCAAGAAYQAHGHALAGNSAACMRTLDEARDIAADPDDDPAAPWANWLSAGYVDIQRARCLTALGGHEEAARLFRETLVGIPPLLRRDRGVYLARQALAHAGAADPDSAAAAGIRAVAIVQVTQSGRIAAELRRLDNTLRRWKSHAAVGEFREAFAGTATIPRQSRAGRG